MTPSCIGVLDWRPLSKRLEVDGRTVSTVERQFVDAGRDARDVGIRAARRSAKRSRRLLVAVGAALIVALIACGVALVQRSDAEQAVDTALESQRTASIEALVGRAESIRSTQRDTAALLAIEAYRLADTPRTRSALMSFVH